MPLLHLVPDPEPRLGFGADRERTGPATLVRRHSVPGTVCDSYRGLVLLFLFQASGCWKDLWIGELGDLHLVVMVNMQNCST